ncbi:triose-phosphate isomerase [Rhodospirillum rubrum]|uniref:triose-phosphate isomerase n=1 Tax=Rhodospirillum rubrum TaxID=1085 RepID=UPI001903F6A7|nr:triose-phosphate isomerase [Rhodospirillum rubrum]MBK1663690.1 triose-phosphate isomerase [Rhodospirillum rubrum]MBK1677430.1 triose-phosphate isomerase [Rhodospirillum rubrum]
MTARRPLIAGNWKMNGLKAEGQGLARDLTQRLNKAGGVDFDLLLCPPFPLISTVVGAVAGSGIAVGGQDCHAKAKGAHTGDVSAVLLADLGCQFVIVGHSERRADHGETDAVVKAKAEAALAAGLIAVICVGETEAQRDAGETLAVVSDQLAGSLPAQADSGKVVIAYEPVWAIGTGRVPTTEDVAKVHGALRKDLVGALGADGNGVRLLYGGSVKPDNAAELMALENVDGALVGGASLKAEDFWAIAQSCG